MMRRIHVWCPHVAFCTSVWIDHVFGVFRLFRSHYSFFAMSSMSHPLWLFALSDRRDGGCPFFTPPALVLSLDRIRCCIKFRRRPACPFWAQPSSVLVFTRISALHASVPPRYLADRSDILLARRRVGRPSCYCTTICSWPALVISTFKRHG